MEDIFRALANLDPDFDPSQMGRDAILEWLNAANHNTFNARLAQVTVSYGDDPQLSEAQLNAQPYRCGTRGVKSYAYIWSNDRTRAHISMCREVFDTYFSLPYTQNPPAQDVGIIPGLGCDGLGDHETDYMTSPGSAFLHELMHIPM